MDEAIYRFEQTGFVLKVMTMSGLKIIYRYSTLKGFKIGSSCVDESLPNFNYEGVTVSLLRNVF